MRFSHAKPFRGERRFVRRFLWFPKRIGNETRWLESAAWNEEYIELNSGEKYWRAINWVDRTVSKIK